MEARRARILGAAAELLADSGSESLTMRRLAEAADVSVNTIYNLIGARDAVVEALVEQVIGEIAVAVDEVGREDSIDRCIAVVDRATALVIENQALTRPLAREIFGHGGPGSLLSRAWGTDTLGAAIAAAVDAGALHDGISPAALAQTVYAVWANSALSWAHGNVDAEGFEAASLSGLFMALLAVATVETEPRLRQGLGDASARLEATQVSPLNRKTA